MVNYRLFKFKAEDVFSGKLVEISPGIRNIFKNISYSNVYQKLTSDTQMDILVEPEAKKIGLYTKPYDFDYIGRAGVVFTGGKAS